MNSQASSVRRALHAESDPIRAVGAARFFKCGPGEYGEGDVFIGVTVPAQRTIARRFRDLPLTEADKLLTSRVHEERSLALFIVVDQFNRSSDDRVRKRIFTLYMKRLRFINNWDLVDMSAGSIVGGWLADKPKDLLDRLARLTHLWSRRVAMIATFHYIRRGDHRDAIRIATILVNDKHDLIHKAVGWMLREVGKRDQAIEERFLIAHHKRMPRTMLRYAIEKFPEPRRQMYLKGII